MPNPIAPWTPASAARLAIPSAGHCKPVPSHLAVASLLVWTSTFLGATFLHSTVPSLAWYLSVLHCLLNRFPVVLSPRHLAPTGFAFLSCFHLCSKHLNFPSVLVVSVHVCLRRLALDLDWHDLIVAAKQPAGDVSPFPIGAMCERVQSERPCHSSVVRGTARSLLGEHVTRHSAVRGRLDITHFVENHHSPASPPQTPMPEDDPSVKMCLCRSPSG